jgi:hypothetical protein
MYVLLILRCCETFQIRSCKETASELLKSALAHCVAPGVRPHQTDLFSGKHSKLRVSAIEFYANHYAAGILLTIVPGLNQCSHFHGSREVNTFHTKTVVVLM